MVEIPLWTAWVIMIILGIGGVSSFVASLKSTTGPEGAGNICAAILNAVVVVYVAMGVMG